MPAGVPAGGSGPGPSPEARPSYRCLAAHGFIWELSYRFEARTCCQLEALKVLNVL